MCKGKTFAPTPKVVLAMAMVKGVLNNVTKNCTIDFCACACLWPWSGNLSHGEGALVLTILWWPG